MKLKGNTLYIILFIALFFVHFLIWQTWVNDFEIVFVKYYLFLTVLFMMVLTILSIIKKIYPEYIGFTFLGLMMFKLTIMFLIMKKLHLNEVPGYKYHFIPPYLVSLLLETLYAINLIQSKQNN